MLSTKLLHLLLLTFLQPTISPTEQTCIEVKKWSLAPHTRAELSPRLSQDYKRLLGIYNIRGVRRVSTHLIGDSSQKSKGRVPSTVMNRTSKYRMSNIRYSEYFMYIHPYILTIIYTQQLNFNLHRSQMIHIKYDIRCYQTYGRSKIKAISYKVWTLGVSLIIRLVHPRWQNRYQ